jgi:hypothetical protein
VGQTFETLWQLFVAIEHGTCLDYVKQLGNPFVSDSFEFHVSPYYFDSFEDRFWLSTFGCRHALRVVILLKLLQREPLGIVTLW